MKTPLIAAACVAALCCLNSPAASFSKGALEVLDIETPIYPHALIQRGILSGDTEVVVSIGPDGKIADFLVISYTDPAFETMSADVLRTLRCKPPASLHNAPSRVTLSLSFETQGVVISHTINDTVENLMTRMTAPQRIEKLGTPRQLDRALVARRTVAPLVPAAAGDIPATKVTLEFLIDETGRARMPVLHAGANWQLADAAASALMNWEFEPPTREGKPVIVAARQEFLFAASSSPRE